MSSKPQKKILILATTFPRWENDNIPSFVLDFAGHLSREHRVTVLAPHFDGSLKRENINNVHVKRFQYAWPARAQNLVYVSHAAKAVSFKPGYILKLLSFVAIQTVNVLIIGKKHDVINAHWLVPQGFVAVFTRRITGKKIVITVHGGDVFSLNGRLMRSAKKYTLRHADEVVVNSSAVKDACNELYEREYNTIPMGTDIERFSNAKSENSDDNKFRVIYVGRLSEEKGVMDVCKSAYLMQKHEGVEFLIVGDGPQRSSVESYVKRKKLKNVRIMGWVARGDLPALMKTAKVLVAPSRNDKSGWKEAFGLVFVEAAASGLVTVGTKTGGIKDIVSDGQTGFLVPEGRPDLIAEKVMYLYENGDALRRMSKNATKRSKQFSWDSVMPKYLEVLFGNNRDRKV